MDIAFEFLLPVEDKLSSLTFQQPEYEWGGEKYPQGSPESMFYSFRLLKSPVPSHIIGMLPNNFGKVTWQCISVLGEGLNNLRESLLGINDNGEDELFELLNVLIGNKSKWVVVFEPDYDRIDEIRNGELEDIFSEIKSSLLNEKKGFIIYKNDNVRCSYV